MTQALYSVLELNDIAHDENVLLVSVLSQEDFNAGHISRSQLVLPSELTLNEKPAPGLLPSTEQLQALLERIGVNSHTTIIAYDNAGGSVAGRFIWTLALFGFNNTALLNGGLQAWKAAELPLHSNAEKTAPSTLNLTLNSDYLASKADVLASLQTDTVIWDARSDEEYAGTKILAERGGHIPGATSFNWVKLHDKNTVLKPLQDIQQALNAAGIDGSKGIITHCQTHRRSGLTWFVGHKLLGWPIKAYAGSWSEWGNDSALPIEQ